MKYLVSGGTGFIGRHIIDEFLRLGQKDIGAMSRSGKGEPRWSNDVKPVRADVLDPDSLPPALDNVEVVIHSVQFPNHPVENPSKGYTYLNFDGKGTQNIVAAAKAAGVRKFVYLSGAGTGRSSSDKPWFRAKEMAESAIRSSGLEYVILRPSWIYGPDDHSLNRFVDFARKLPFIPIIGNGQNRAQPISVFDVAHVAVEAALRDDLKAGVFELGGPETLTMDQIMRQLLDVLGKKRMLIHQPAGLMKLLSLPLQILPTPPLSPQAIDFILMDCEIDPKPAQDTFKMLFMSLKEGLSQYLKPEAKP